MAHWKSTMGAPLTEAEETHIELAWYKLDEYVDTFPIKPDPIEMLEHLAELVGRCHELQRLIHDCWSSANRRAFPATREARKSNAVHSALADLRSLGISPDELLEALKTMGPKAALTKLTEEPSE